MTLQENYQQIVDDHRKYVEQGNTVDYTFRKHQLEKIKKILKDYETEIYDVLKKRFE